MAFLFPSPPKPPPKKNFPLASTNGSHGTESWRKTMLAHSPPRSARGHGDAGRQRGAQDPASAASHLAAGSRSRSSASLLPPTPALVPTLTQCPPVVGVVANLPSSEKPLGVPSP